MNSLNAVLRCTCVVVVVGAALSLLLTPNIAVVEDDASQGQTQQLQTDLVNRPELIPATAEQSQDVQRTFDTTDGTVVNEFVGSDQSDIATFSVGATVVDVRVNLLNWAKNADKDKLSFSWKNTAGEQTSYNIVIYQRKQSDSPLFSTGKINGSAHKSVTVNGLGSRLQPNQLYYVRVSVTYNDGTTGTSDRVPFVTAVGNQFVSRDFVWTKEQSIANLIRTKIEARSNVEKAILIATALDTETSLRHVFNVFVNGDEVGIGPTRRAGNRLYYNSYDVTSALSVQSANVIGLYSYSQAKQSGILMQLTYFYTDGTSEVIYNSGRDMSATQIYKMDNVVYGTSNASIGTSYVTELAQNATVNKFPYSWQSADDYNRNPWSVPARVNIDSSYVLEPSIVDNVVRQRVSAESVTKNSDGSYTVKFAKEIIGDIELTASASTATGIRITESEELSGGKAKVPMRTDNAYDETWTFQGNNVTFTGFSLRGFRYVTVYNYPGTLTLDKISGIETFIPTSGKSHFSSNNSLLNSIVGLAQYTYRETALDTIVDSVTRERRPYEGDTLVYQALAYANGDVSLESRNTWNYLMENPTQYTEYRLMTILGVYEDYLHTADVQYVNECYGKLQKALTTVTYNPDLGLVRSNGTTDLIDWPRTEISGYDFTNTTYKTAINAVAYRAYEAMNAISQALGKKTKADDYATRAANIKKKLIESLYDAKTHTFYDGLTSNRSLQSHHSWQNDFFVLSMGIYEDQNMANAIAKAITQSDEQPGGSIYAAYFFYSGLISTGNSDYAMSVLGNTSGDRRTYGSVINTLGATIAPESWDTASKSNMTYSHAWGSGGCIAILQAALSIERSTDGQSDRIILQPAAMNGVSSTISTLDGDVSVRFAENNGGYDVTLLIPPDMETTLTVPKLENGSRIEVDGVAVSATYTDFGAEVAMQPGRHVVHIVPVVS